MSKVVLVAGMCETAPVIAHADYIGVDHGAVCCMRQGIAMRKAVGAVSYTHLVTSQVGCNMACAFCASGLTKKKRNLTSGEMVAQVLYVQRDLDKQEDRLSHIVVMGTGEPFDNYEHVMNFL